MVIFNSYVKLPEGMCDHNSNDHQKKKSEDQESSRIPWLLPIREDKKRHSSCVQLYA